MEDEIEALAAEIAKTAPHLSYDQLRDAAAAELAELQRYAHDWNAERRAAWYDLRAFARRWDLRAAVDRALNKGSRA